MVDLTTAHYLVIGALSIAPLYTVGSGIKKLITGKYLPGTKVAAQITLVEIIATLFMINPVLADKNLDKTYGIKELIDAAKVTLPYNSL